MFLCVITELVNGFSIQSRFYKLARTVLYIFNYCVIYNIIVFLIVAPPSVFVFYVILLFIARIWELDSRVRRAIAERIVGSVCAQPNLLA